METVTLYRKRSGDQGTFGIIEIGNVTYVTGELPWRDNTRQRSCVPAGTYLCRMRFSPRFGRNVYQLQNVPDRTVIEIHPGNVCGDVDMGFKADVDGCILLGTAAGEIDGQEAVLHSRNAVDAFEKAMDYLNFELVIVDEYLETGAPGPATSA